MLQLVNLSAGYHTAPVLRDVNLTARGGECLALLGRNGSGKTTLLRAACGLLKPLAGNVLLRSRPVRSMSARARARFIAVVPQQEYIPPGVSAIEMTLLGRYPWLSWLGTYSRADHEAALAALAAVDAQNLADREVAALSGGERQRVLLARALAQGSPVILLDEPTANLDPARMTELLDLLERRRAAGSLVIMALHDCNIAALYATRLVGIREGRLAFDGPVEETFTAERLSALYGAPLRVIPHPDFPVPQALHKKTAILPSPRPAEKI